MKTAWFAESEFKKGDVKNLQPLSLKYFIIYGQPDNYN
jgi:hypothetical protein